jgi:hypothetical protein
MVEITCALYDLEMGILSEAVFLIETRIGTQRTIQQHGLPAIL